jgi:branched-chain amino acid transport system substrate-binding protein
MVALGAVSAVSLVGFSPGAVVAGAKSAPKKCGTIKIGSLHSLTGSSAAAGTSTAGSVRVGVSAVNQAGGVKIGSKCYNFAITTLDSASSPTTAGLQTITMIQDGIHFIFGTEDSPTLAAAQAAAVSSGAQEFFFSPALTLTQNLAASSKPPTSPLIQYSYAVGAGPAQAYGATARQMRQWYPQAKSVVILYPSGASNDTLAADTQQAAKAAGMRVIKIVRYDPTTTDFSATLTSIKAARPDVLWMGTLISAETAITEQSAALGGVSKYLVASQGSAAMAQGSATGGVLSTPYVYYDTAGTDPAAPTPGLAQYLRLYPKVVGSSPPAQGLNYATYDYGPVLALAAAMEKAKSVTDLTKINSTLTKVSVPTILGSFSYTPNHLAKLGVAVCRVILGVASCTTVPFVAKG